MSTAMPTVVFVPGYWHTSEGFGPLASILRYHKYSTVLIDVPSAGAHPSHPDFSQDVSTIRTIVENLSEEGKDIIVVMHSGGSVAGSEAVQNFAKKDRTANGEVGGVIRLVYIGILLPKAGQSMLETFQSVISSPDLDPDFVIDQNQDFHVIAEDGTSIITDGSTRFYNGLPDSEANYWSSRLTSCSLGIGMSRLTYEAWNHIPSAYIICLQDKSIPLKQVRQIVKDAGIEMILEIETGHCPHLVRPSAVAQFIREAAGEPL